MFTGIIESTGEVVSFRRGAGGVSRLTVAAGEVAGRLRLGDSVAVSGVCLTAVEIGAEGDAGRFSADLAAETIARTTLAGLQPGARVNLELPTPAGAPLGGHVVQGHVDGVGTVVGLEPVQEDAAPPERERSGEKTDWVLRVRLPAGVRQYVVAKGSIAVEGISLTVAGIEGEKIWIAILPHTYAATNLHTLKAGMGVNIEVDVMAKYAEAARAAKRELTVEYLLANGY
ncbi:MAG TPA: riboflavin synthase [Acidobacteriaceae bacterium]|nr:riboflavin synthase [Acidobacteriaceae bacterium]